MNKIIISFNCAGGAIYTKLNYKYNTPLVGHLFRSDEDFLKFCLDLKNNLNADVIATQPLRQRYYGVSNKNYVVTKHNNIEIHWIHDYNPRHVIENFKRRLERIINTLNENAVIVFSETCLGKDKQNVVKFNDFIKQFSLIPFNKVFLSSKEINIDGINTDFVKVVPKWKNKKFWEKCGVDFNCRNGTCPGCGRTSYGNYGGVAERYSELCL